MGKGSHTDSLDLQVNRKISEAGNVRADEPDPTNGGFHPANIAEGCGKDSDPELKRYFLISMGSASELEYLLILAHDLGYLPGDAFLSMTNDLIEIRKMLNAFIQTLKATAKR